MSKSTNLVDLAGDAIGVAAEHADVTPQATRACAEAEILFERGAYREAMGRALFSLERGVGRHHYAYVALVSRIRCGKRLVCQDDEGRAPWAA